MDDLLEFVKARLDECAALARSATPGPWEAEAHYHPSKPAIRGFAAYSDPGRERLNGDFQVHPVAKLEGNGEGGVLTEADAVHIVRHDPARVLAEVEAKRQVLTGYVKTVEAVEDLAALLERLRRKGHDTLMAEMDQAARIHQRDTLQGVLRLLALPYAAHPDYREEWRP